MEKLINSLEELKVLASNSENWLECYISLGIARSSKRIYFDEDEALFYIHNEIDDTEQTLKESELSKNTNLIKAIENNRLFRY
jgi:hypothetical protein